MTENLRTTIRTACGGKWGIVLTVLMALAILGRLGRFLPFFLDPTNFPNSEYMLSFSGGYVRRGLLGQVMLWFCETFGCRPMIPALIFFGGCYVMTVIWFCRAFIRRRWPIWLVLCPLMCGYVIDLPRKDYLLILLTLSAIYIITRKGNWPWRTLATTAIILIGILLHEAYIFWGGALAGWLLLCRRDIPAWARAGAAVCALGLFAIQCLNHGDASTAAAITEAWTGILGPEFSNEGIDFLGKSTSQAVALHIGLAYLTTWDGLWSIFIQFPLYLVLFFIASQYPWSFNHSGRRASALLASVFIMLTFTMLPMFTALSCDHGRNYLYIIAMSYGAILLCPRRMLGHAIPLAVYRPVYRITRFCRTILRPTYGLMGLLTFVVGVSPYGFATISMFTNSAYGYYVTVFSNLLSRFASHFPYLKTLLV